MEINRKSILSHMRKKKVMTIVQFSTLMCCAVITARRRQKKWKAVRSCNQNGKFYTLPEVAFFDDTGLWRYEGILFSSNGNLKETIVYLVNASQAGLNRVDLERLLGVTPKNPIVYQLRDEGLLRLEKVEGKVTLLDVNEKNYRQQRAEREKEELVSLPKCEEGLMILVEMIKNPGAELIQVKGLLRKIGCNISVASIKRFLDHHDLSKKNTDTTL